MSLTILPRYQPRSTGVYPSSPAVYVAGRWRPDLRISRWLRRGGPLFDELTLRCLRDTSETWARLPAEGSAVMVDDGIHRVEFVVLGRSAGLSDRRDDLELRLGHRLAWLLNKPIRGRWIVANEGPAFDPESSVRVNRPGAWADASLHEINGRSTRVHNPAGGAPAWTIADALQYLLAAFAPAELDWPEPDEMDALAGEIICPPMDLTDLPLAEALVRVASPAGLEWRASASNPRRLVLYRPGTDGPVRSLHLARRGQTLSESGSLIAAVALHHQPADAAGIEVVGGLSRHESTWLLQPGWRPDQTPDTYLQTVRSRGDAMPPGSRFGRLWVLNEAGQYSDAPWNLPLHSLSRFDPEAFVLDVPRRLEPCISNASDLPGGVLVEISIDEGATWKRYAGPVRLADAECSIEIGGDELPGRWYRACQDGDARVRITASVRSDTPVRASIAGDPGRPPRRVDQPWARRDVVHPESQLHAGGDGPEIAHDDTGRLMALADRLREQIPGAAAATVTLALPNGLWQVGDRVEGIVGRALPLAAGRPARPVVRQVTHQFDDTWTTQLQIEG